MNALHQCRLVVLLLLSIVTLAGAAFAGRTDLNQEALEEPVVEYRVDLRQPQTQKLKVTITVPTAGIEAEDFCLPVWRPGRYTVLNQAGTVRGVRAISETGAELPIRKIDKSTWRVQTNGASSVSVTYSVYANSLRDRTRHVDLTHAFLSGSAVFFYSPRLRHAPVRVEVDAPAGWDIASGLDHAPGREDVVVAANYDVLADSPLEIGEHDRFEFEVEGRAHEIVIWPAGVDLDAEQMIEDFSTIITEQMDVFGALPYERYVFLIHAGAGGGGTEHLNSTIMQTSRGAIEGSKGRNSNYKRFLGLVSHEFFHTWNVKQFRPAGIHPYDYQNENCTDLLWVCEGSTSYYSSLTLVRSELSEAEGYITRIGSAGNSLRNNPAARVQSVAEASWDSWVGSSDPDTRNRTVDFYGKGSQVSLCLDMELRRRTDNRVSFDDVMKELFVRFPLSGEGYTSNDLMILLEELAGSSFEEFFEAYVFGTEELPFEEALPVVGLEFYFDANGVDEDEEEDGKEVAEVEVEDEEENAVEVIEEVVEEEAVEAEPVQRELQMKAYLGLRLSGGGSGSTVSGFSVDGPAYTSGLMIGDEILTLNERRLRSGDLDRRLEDFEPGDMVKLHYLRDDLLRVMEIELGGVPDGSWRVRRVENPSDAQIEAYESWIGREWPGKEKDEEGNPKGEGEGEGEPEVPDAAPEAVPVSSPVAGRAGEGKAAAGTAGSTDKQD